jgi:hypothetical protein
LLKHFGESCGNLDTNLSNLEFVQFLKLFINFPKDDIITTWKWNLMLVLFGPFDNWEKTFREFALSAGFMGVMNRIRAQEILVENITDAKYQVTLSICFS